MSNMGLEEYLKQYGGKLVRTNVGDRYVVEEMKKNGYNLGGEKSGHLIYSDMLFTGDGLIGALKVLAVMKRRKSRLSELSSSIKLFPQKMISIKVKKRVPLDKCNEINKVVDDIVARLENNGRIVLRFSGTEPKIRLMIEGKDEKEIDGYMKRLEKTIRNELS